MDKKNYLLDNFLINNQKNLKIYKNLQKNLKFFGLIFKHLYTMNSTYNFVENKILGNILRFFFEDPMSNKNHK